MCVCVFCVSPPAVRAHACVCASRSWVAAGPMQHFFPSHLHCLVIFGDMVHLCAPQVVPQLHQC